jgi:hypothetical protein
MTTPEFVPFPKIPRLRRMMVVTEKIDGTNAQVHIAEDGEIFAGSRTRWLTPGKSTDNYGFAAWVEEHRAELAQLGPGTHFGEWWGRGINRGYGLTERRFSLFNTARWGDASVRPECCGVVPVLAVGETDAVIEEALSALRLHGSFAAPGFTRPEGVVVFHTAGSHLYKVLLENDACAKGQAA